MIYMQQMQFNAPNVMHVFQNLSGGNTPGPPFHAVTLNRPLPSKILAACLARTHIIDKMLSLHCRSLIGFVISSVLWRTLSTTTLVYPSLKTQLSESHCFMSPICSDPPRQANLTYFAPEQNSARELSLWQENDNATHCQPRSEIPPKIFALKCAIKTFF